MWRVDSTAWHDLGLFYFCRSKKFVIISGPQLHDEIKFGHSMVPFGHGLALIGGFSADISLKYLPIIFISKTMLGGREEKFMSISFQIFVNSYKRNTSYTQLCLALTLRNCKEHRGPKECY